MATFESMLTASRERQADLALRHLPIDKVVPDPDQPRKAFEPAPLAELAQSIAQDGILHPLLVMPADPEGLFRLIAGERRWRAAQEAGLRRVPAFIIQRDEIGRRRVQLVENLQRVDLTATERAQHVAMMRELVSLQTRAEGRALAGNDLDDRVGAMLGISGRAVRDFLSAVSLPEAVQEVARRNGLSIKHLRAARMVGTNNAEPFIAAAAAAHMTGDQALDAARMVRDEELPIAEAVAHIRPLPPPPGPAAPQAEPVDEPPAGQRPLRPGTDRALRAMPRGRRSVYERLLEVERLLARLPLLEAADPGEAALWMQALDALSARVESLRRSLHRLEDGHTGDANGEEGRADG